MNDTPAIDQDLRDRVQRHFGATAQDYVTSARHASGGGLDQLVELAEPTADSDALDIATGGGHTALALAPHVRHIVASDLTPNMLVAAQAFLREKGITNASFEIAEAEDLPFGDDSFDIVTCRVAPHHFSDVQAFCRETARVLRPGGRLILIDSYAPDDDALDEFINQVERRRDNSHARSWRILEWRAFIEIAGLTIDHVEPFVRRFEFDEWTLRTRMTPDAKQDLEQYMLSAPQRVRDFFNVTVTDGHVEAFDDNKVIVRARKG
ncbi:MAG: class I SAM-dependent methyltransferase [Thermomicrobiales bacterium]